MPSVVEICLMDQGRRVAWVFLPRDEHFDPGKSVLSNPGMATRWRFHASSFLSSKYKTYLGME